MSTLRLPTAGPWGVRAGPAALFRCVWGVLVWGPVTSLTADALESWRCVLSGRQEGARGGRGPPASVTCVWGWALCLPPLPVLGTRSRGPFPAFLGSRTCWPGGHSPTPQRTLLGAGVARFCGGRGRPGGDALCLGEVFPGLGTLPFPLASSLAVRPGPAARFPWARGVRV